MDQFVDLFLNRSIICPVPVAKREDRDPGAKVKVFFSVDIVQPHTLSPLKYNRKAVVSVEYILLRFIHDILGI